MLQAAVVSAEQQVSSLEAALQKGSQVTLSMTEKVAQTLAASNAQVEALKVRAEMCVGRCLTYCWNGGSKISHTAVPWPRHVLVSLRPRVGAQTQGQILFETEIRVALLIDSKTPLQF